MATEGGFLFSGGVFLFVAEENHTSQLGLEQVGAW